MEEESIAPKLRSYTPIVAGFAASGDADSTQQDPNQRCRLCASVEFASIIGNTCWQAVDHLQRQGLLPGQPEHAALLQADTAAGRDVSARLDQLRRDVPQASTWHPHPTRSDVR